MRCTEATYDGQPLPERMILSNTYELLITGQWQKQTDLEHVSLKHAINHPDLADVYTASIWEFAQDMYYKQPKKGCAEPDGCALSSLPKCGGLSNDYSFECHSRW